MPDVTAQLTAVRAPALAARPGASRSPARPAPRRDADRSRHRLVASLLDGSCLVADLRAASALLGLPVDGLYQVVALDGGGPAARAAGRATVGGSGLRVHWHSSRPVEHALVLLAEGGSSSTPPARSATDRVPHLPPGVRLGAGLPVQGLAGLADGRRQAHTALALCAADGGRTDLADHLPTALLTADPELALQLGTQVLGPLATTDPAEREVLLDTFTAWLAADGSTRTAAADLGCHRNTVTNRLRRLERLTGRRVDSPRDLVDLTLAVRAHRLPGTS
ncbi:PucR family transcriptional regulator [Isoptericola aurantiacus]|uniref:PucR family transcriptional regulator n=1 Tax=Isoptericola aurantiacus TaxID=3377839 RepID=UPI00383B4D19